MNKISVDQLKIKGKDLLDGMLYKYTIREGTGETVPAKSEVQIKLQMIVQGQTLIEYASRPYVKVVEKILPPGLSVAIQSMCKGEVSLIWMHSQLAYGRNAVHLGGQSKVPKMGNVVFKVIVESWIEKDETAGGAFRKNRLTIESLPLAHEEFLLAESLLNKGQKMQALRAYKFSLHKARQMQIDAVEAPAEEESRSAFVFFVTLKAAECALDLGRYPQAVTLSRDCLQLDPFNAKASFICGCAYFSLGCYYSACSMLRAAHHNDLANKTYEGKLKEIEQHRALLENDVDYDSDREEYEDFAAHLLNKLKANEKKFKKAIESFVNKRIEEGVRSFKIGGGFRPEFIKKVGNRIVDRNKYFRVNAQSDYLHLYV